MSEDFGTTSSYVNRGVKKKEGVINKTFVKMMEALGYDIELTYAKRAREGGGGNRMFFRHSAGFGKRMEYSIIARLLMEGVDCVIKKGDGMFIEVQVKAGSSEVAEGDSELLSAITHEMRKDFLFFIQRP